jgi:uncharacterized protein
MRSFLTAILILLTFAAQAQIEKVVPAKPPVSKGLVHDYTGTLTIHQAEALNQKLIAYDDSTSSQIAVVIIQSLEGYDIAEYALALGRSWGIGGKEFSNGVLVLIAMDERKSRIEVGYGLEGAITDITARSILDNSIAPNFKQGNYYRGLDEATDNIIKAAAGEYKAPANYGSKKKKVGCSIIGCSCYYFWSGGGEKGRGGVQCRRSLAAF